MVCAVRLCVCVYFSVTYPIRAWRCCPKPPLKLGCSRDKCPTCSEYSYGGASSFFDNWFLVQLCA